LSALRAAAPGLEGKGAGSVKPTFSSGLLFLSQTSRPKLGAKIIKAGFLIELKFLQGREKTTGFELRVTPHGIGTLPGLFSSHEK